MNYGNLSEWMHASFPRCNSFLFISTEVVEYFLSLPLGTCVSKADAPMLYLLSRILKGGMPFSGTLNDILCPNPTGLPYSYGLKSQGFPG